MKLRSIALVPAALLLSACGGGSDPVAVKTVTVTAEAEPAASQIDWDYIRTEYADTLAKTNCGAIPGTMAGACNQIQNSRLATMRLDIEQLAPSRARTAMLESLGTWEEKYEEYSDEMCLGSLNTGQLDCTFKETLLDLNMAAIEGIAKNAAD